MVTVLLLLFVGNKVDKLKKKSQSSSRPWKNTKRIVNKTKLAVKLSKANTANVFSDELQEYLLRFKLLFLGNNADIYI